MSLMLSPAMVSNLYTISCTAKVDASQTLPSVPYTVPCEAVRKLRAKLILEEAIETIHGLGFIVQSDVSIRPRYDYNPHDWDKSIEKVIDGCVDTIYVATGTLAAYGVPDLPHIVEVNRANDAKFPNGIATLRSDGKFQKPDGWTGPDHARVRDSIPKLDLFEHGQARLLLNR